MFEGIQECRSLIDRGTFNQHLIEFKCVFLRGGCRNWVTSRIGLFCLIKKHIRTLTKCWLNAPQSIKDRHSCMTSNFNVYHDISKNCSLDLEFIFKLINLFFHFTSQWHSEVLLLPLEQTTSSRLYKPKTMCAFAMRCGRIE